MKEKECKYCGAFSEPNAETCPACGRSLSSEHEHEIADEEPDAFTEAVKRVAEAFFAMSPEEQQAMTEYVQSRCDEAERQYRAMHESKRK